MRSSFLVAALCLVACTPDLREGYFACSTGACPSGWFCGKDGFCYRTSDGSTQDANTPTPIYGSCPVGQTGDTSCASGLCAPGPDTTATTGQCSTNCTDDASCPGAPNAWCIAGTCVGTCRQSSDCSSGLGCYGLAGRTGKACFDVADPRLASTYSCTGAADCQPWAPCLLDPLLDAQGVCSWVCTGPGDTCPLGAECEDVSALHSASPTGYACLAHCGASCANGLSCQKFPGVQKHCVPSGW